MDMMILAASNLPCIKCRELTCSLIKSVDAFEILASGNSAIPTDLLISTIRQIVAKTVTKEDKDVESEGKNMDTITTSNSASTTIVHINANNSCSLNVDIQNQKDPTGLPIPSPSFDDLLDSGESLDDRKMQMKRGVKWRGRGRRGRKRIRIGMPQKSGIRRTRYKSLPLMDSGEEDTSDISNNINDQYQNQITNPNCRTLPTHEDYERASQYMKKVQMETRDGFFYNLFECITCSRQFSQSQNLRRHIVSLHFNKKVISLGRATRHMVTYNSKVRGKMTKVRLYAKEGSSNRTSLNSTSSFCLVPTNPIPEQKRGRKGKILQTIQMQLENHNQNQNQSHMQYHTTILSKYGLPPNFTVRNPFKDFDLEKTLNARVSISSFPMLSTVAIKAEEENDKKPFKEEIPDDKKPFKEEIPDDKAESSSFSVSTDTSCYHSIPECPPKIDYYPRINYDKIDLIEMDVDTIMAIEF